AGRREDLRDRLRMRRRLLHRALQHEQQRLRAAAPGRPPLRARAGTRALRRRAGRRAAQGLLRRREDGSRRGARRRRAGVDRDPSTGRRPPAGWGGCAFLEIEGCLASRMPWSVEVIAAVSPAVYGLVGSLIGALAAGTASYVVARQARKAAERAWVRDNRREIYDRFLTCAQRLLIALEQPRANEHAEDVEKAYIGFFEANAVVQTVAERPVVEAARAYAYQLKELEEELDSGKPSGGEYSSRVARCVRLSRHDTIDAMRAELGLVGQARPPGQYNPFAGTGLEE